MPDESESEHARAFLDAQKKGVQQDVSPDDYGFDQSKFPDITTKAEKEHLEASRSQPSFEHPEPGGWTPPSANSSDSKDAAEREERIEFLRDRLSQEQERFEHDLDQSFDIER